MAYGGKVKDPRWLNKRARDFLDEFHQAQEQLQAPMSHSSATARVWQPTLDSALKLNFDAAIFSDLNCSRARAVIRNEKGEVMASMSARGPPVKDSEEVEIIACRKAMEFAIDAGFTELIVEGDNVAIMNALTSSGANQS